MNNFMVSIEKPTSTWCPQERMNTLMLSHVIRYMSGPRYHALCCSSGSHGYHAFKEMLMCGLPGETLLLESIHMRDVPTVRESPSTATVHSRLPPRAFCRLFHKAPKKFTHSMIPPHITTLSIITNATGLPNFILRQHTQIREINIHATYISRLPVVFLAECSGLTTLDLSPLARITELPEGFLKGCSGLTSLDLSPLTHLKELPEDFLAGCSGITSLSIGHLSQDQAALLRAHRITNNVK